MMHWRGHKVLIALLGVLVMVAVIPAIIFGDIPQQVNFQGSLGDDHGNPLDGDYVMVFSIYDLGTSGSALWWEQQTVTVTNGIYNVQIGQDPVGNPFPDDLFDGQRWLGVAVGTDTEMTPRQPLTSVPYAIQAGSTPVGAVTSIMLADEAVTETKVAAGAITADKIDGGTGSGVDADKLDGLDASSFASSTHNHDALYYTKSYINALENRIQNLETKLQYLSVVAGTVNGMPGPHVMITGANLHVRSGSGYTHDTVNGRGNLIVGYNELRGSGDNRSGSHNIVTGRLNNYTSFGGLVAGHTNTISGEYTTVTGGALNEASGHSSSISGGAYNTATNNSASVSGGYSNEASGTWSSVSGGFYNDAIGNYSSISGGRNNEATNNGASVSGGESNTASGNYASVSGGYANKAEATDSSVSGGYVDSVSGAYDWRAGNDYFSND